MSRTIFKVKRLQYIGLSTIARGILPAAMALSLAGLLGCSWVSDARDADWWHPGWIGSEQSDGGSGEAPPDNADGIERAILEAASPSSGSAGDVRFADLRNGHALEQLQPQDAARVKEIPWIADGISPVEADGANNVVDLALFYTDIFYILADYGWMDETVGDMEFDAIEHLMAIAQRDSAAALQLAAMPFMTSMEPSDEVALRSLRIMLSKGPAMLSHVMSHSANG